MAREPEEGGGVTEDLAAFFGDLSVSAAVVTGTATSTESVYFDNPSVMALAGAVMMDTPSLIARASAAIRRGSSVTIGTNGYTVRMVEKLDDGAFVRATLEAV